MTISPKQLDLKGAYIQDVYAALEDELFEMLIKSLKSKTFTEISNDTVFQWQLEKMQQLNMMNFSTITNLAKKASEITEKELRNLITNQGYDLLKESNKEFAILMGVDVKEWSQLDQILNQYFDSQWRELENFVNQSLISTNYQINSFSQAYTNVLNNVTAKVLTGMITPHQAFKSAIYETVGKGMMTSFVDKGGREWSLERYVRTVIKTTTHHIYNDLRVDRGKQYGIVTALMSSKAAARDACSHIQGGWVLTVPTKEAPLEFQHIKSIYDYGYGKPEGTQGIQCNHRLYAAVPGVNTNNMPKPPSPETAQENAKIVAKQRRMEVAIRQAKKSLNAAKMLDDEEDVEHFGRLIRTRQAGLRQLIQDNKELLHRDYGREAVYS